MPKHRIERVTERIKQVLSEVIAYELKDPRVGLITVTRVKLTPDLAKATVFLSVMGDEAKQRTSFRALEHARGHIQTVVTSRIRIRRHPEIVFKLDEGYQKGQRISRILSELQAESASENETAVGPATDLEEGEAEP